MRRVVVVLVLALAGCGSGGRTCARNDVAELCAARSASGYRIEAKGLRPGSEVTITAQGRVLGRPQRVGPDGTPEGAVAIFGRDFEARVDAVAGDDEHLHLAVGSG